MCVRSLIWFLAVMVSFVTVAQEKKTEYYNQYYHVVEKSKSYTYQVGMADHEGWQDTVRGYFTKTDSVFFIALYKDGKRDGKYFQYYENGNLEFIGNFLQGEWVGETKYFYPSGQQWKILDYSDSEDGDLISYWDSAGNELVKDGRGQGQFCHFNKVYADGSVKRIIVCENGYYEMGKKTGTWSGKISDGVYSEIYENGILTAGESTLDSGEKFNYSAIEEAADFPGGLKNFYSSLSKVMGTYPKEARKKGIDGKVFIQFEVDRDGRIQNPKIFQGIGYGCDEVALAAVNGVSEKWIPGKQRGVNVRQRMIVPIMFKLN